MKVYEQTLNGKVRARLIVNRRSGMARIERLDEHGGVVAVERFGAGAGQVAEFRRDAEPIWAHAAKQADES